METIYISPLPNEAAVVDDILIGIGDRAPKLSNLRKCSRVRFY
ncbi:hypothetical protein [Nostoc flagelliforme]|nr:hypothetical protein [Nostoc flagelliforme]